ncbi:shikimate kinase AroK [Bacillus carboniphilus]|uniref:Shikimate kinase n=1 Tax=Bacillus carboniphilus TaxID=86663 RepID=A0ABP3GL30_9BACI
METIFLTGFMGAGKSTIARQLGKKLNKQVVDTDQLIVHREGKNIPDIFATKGETYFRQLETEVLTSLDAELIVSTGGGLIVRPENRKWMLENGYVIFLDCDIQEIWRRINGDKGRPLARNQAEVTALYESRKPLYNQCHFKVDTTHLSIDAITETIMNELESY